MVPQGRRISLDSNNRIKTIVAWAVADDPFVGATIIVRRCPAVMLVAKAGGRMQMPEWCVLLQRRGQYELHAGPHAPPALDARVHEICVLCLSSEANDFQNECGRSNELYGCTRCGLSWHIPCARWALQSAGKSDADLFAAPRKDCPVCVDEPW